MMALPKEEAEVSNCCEIGKQSQVLPDQFKLFRVESGFQVGLEFDKQKTCRKYKIFSVKKVCGQWWGWRDEFFVFTVKILLLFRGKEATLVLVSSGKNLRPEFRSWWKNYGPVKKVFRLWPTFREQLFKMS